MGLTWRLFVILAGENYTLQYQATNHYEQLFFNRSVSAKSEFMIYEYTPQTVPPSKIVIMGEYNTMLGVSAFSKKTGNYLKLFQETYENQIFNFEIKE